ncbi:MAG: hypothetical protein ACJAQS_001614 [Porticoccus sp.]|jgi:hypothetical protein
MPECIISALKNLSYGSALFGLLAYSCGAENDVYWPYFLLKSDLFETRQLYSETVISKAVSGYRHC